MSRFTHVAVLLCLIFGLATGCQLLGVSGSDGGAGGRTMAGNMGGGTFGGSGGGTFGGSGGVSSVETPHGGGDMFEGGGDGNTDMDAITSRMDRLKRELGEDDAMGILEGLKGMQGDIEANAAKMRADAKDFQADAEVAAEKLKTAAEALVALMKAGSLTEDECETQLTELVRTSVAKQTELAKAQFTKMFSDPAMKGLMEATGGAMGNMDAMILAMEAMNAEMIPVTVAFYLGKITEAEYLAKTQELTQKFLKLQGMGR